MPSVSKKQHGFMAAVANNPKFAKKVGVSKSIGEEFMKADKGRKFKEGGLKETDAASNPGLAKLPTAVRNKMGYMKKGGMAHSDIKMDKKVVKKAVGMHEKQLHGGKKSDLAALKKGGKVKKFALGGMSQEQMPPQMPSGLTMRRPFGGGASGAYGGLDVVNQGSQQVGKSLDTIGGALGTPGGGSMRPRLPGVIMKKGGSVKSKKMASGGKVGQLSKADGCAVKGKTKGSMVKMKKGGSC
jgi:hypothetical protein